MTKIKHTVLAFLLGVFTVGCGGASEVADGGYLGSGYTIEQLDSMGVNTGHLFVFTEERATYNGQQFSIHIPIDSLVELLGPCERIVYGTDHNAGYDDYFWDEIGFTAQVSPERVVMRFGLHWDYLPKEEEYHYDDPEPELVPAKFFKGKILLNGFPLDNTSDYEAYCNNKELQSRLIDLARKNGVKRNYEKCLYHFVNMYSFTRYQPSYHKLYFFDYTPFDDDPFFAYKVKTLGETGKIHEFGMQYDVYTNPNFIEIF